MRTRAISSVIAVLVIIIVILAAVAGVGWYQALSSTSQTQTSQTSQTQTSQTQTSQTSGVQTIRVGSLPITDEMPFFMAIQYGIFARYNINIQISSCPGSGGCIEALESNTVDVAMVAPPAVLEFAGTTGNYLKLLAIGKLVGQIDNRTGDGPAFVVRQGVSVTSPSDLAGKTILTNAIGGPNMVVPLYLMEKAGVSNSSVTWKEVNFPNMPQVIAAGQADAASPAQPFTAEMIQQGTAYPIDNLFGNHSIFVDALGNPALVSAWWVTPQKYASDPGLYNRFTQAVYDGLAYCYALPQVCLNATSTYTKVPASALATFAFSTALFYPYPSNSTAVANLLGAWANVVNYTGYVKTSLNMAKFQ